MPLRCSSNPKNEGNGMCLLLPIVYKEREKKGKYLDFRSFGYSEGKSLDLTANQRLNGRRSLRLESTKLQSGKMDNFSKHKLIKKKSYCDFPMYCNSVFFINVKLIFWVNFSPLLALSERPH